MTAAADSERERLVELLTRDVLATVGESHEEMIRSYARSHQTFDIERSDYVESVVEWVQQEFHDDFIDTTWPACPRHSTHPLWFRDGWWCCDKDRVRIAELGSLEAVNGAG